MAEIESDTPEWLKKQINLAESGEADPTLAIANQPTAPEVAGVSLEDLGEIAQIPEESYSTNEPEDIATAAPVKNKVTPGDVATKEEFLDLANELGLMLADKNRQYGDSYARMAHVLPIFYPDGVPPEQLLDAVFILRIVDKLMRIASAQGDDLEDPVKDIAGYGILRMREMRHAND